MTQVELGYTVESIASMVAKLAIQLEYMSEFLIEDKDLPPEDEKYTETKYKIQNIIGECYKIIFSSNLLPLI